MGYAIVTKTHVDALITTARRWSRSTLAFQLPPQVANELNLTDEAANQLGLTLLITNWNNAVLGGDPDEQGLDSEDIAWMEQEYIDDGFAKPTGYTLDELPGEPAPESALRLIASYRYQSNWEGDGLGAVTAFVDALETAARQQLGHEADDLEGLPRYRDTPWLPSDGDRDMFITGN